MLGLRGLEDYGRTIEHLFLLSPAARYPSDKKRHFQDSLHSVYSSATSIFLAMCHGKDQKFGNITNRGSLQHDDIRELFLRIWFSMLSTALGWPLQCFRTEASLWVRPSLVLTTLPEANIKGH